MNCFNICLMIVILNRNIIGYDQRELFLETID
jgi:hypothetical protein